MTTLPVGSTSTATPTSPLDPIVTLLSAVPLGSWMWVAIAISSMWLFAYAAYRTASVLTSPSAIEPVNVRYAREAEEARS